MSKPLITTIIPTYRRPQLLKRAIKSVLNQTYPNFHVCVYDNASGDETDQVVSEIAKSDSRVKYYCHDENIGALKNFIYGLERVNTPFYSFLSDDDVLLSGFYKTALTNFEKYPDAMFSITPTLTMDEEGNIYENTLLYRRPGFYSPPHGLICMLEWGHPIWTGVLFRREMKDKIRLSEKLWEDESYLLRAAACCQFIVSQSPGAIFFVYPSSYTGQTKIEYPWLTMEYEIIRILAENGVAPIDMLRKIVNTISTRSKKGLFRNYFKGIIDSNDEYKKYAYNLLNHHYPHNFETNIVNITNYIDKIPIVRIIFILLNRLRNFFYRLKNGYYSIWHENCEYGKKL